MTVTNNIYQKQIKYHVFNVVTNSELTELVPVLTMRPAFPTSFKKVNTSFKNVLPPRSDRSDEFQKLCYRHLLCD